jgi:hypothetical protein
MFVFPMPNPEKGYYFMLSQMKAFDKTCLFTPLSEFQQLGSNAPQWLKMTYYTELQDTKGITTYNMYIHFGLGIVLMRGEVDTNVLTTQAAQFLANLWQLYHLDDTKYKKMQTFNHEPSKFDYNDLLKDLDSLPEAKSPGSSDPSTSSS